MSKGKPAPVVILTYGGWQRYFAGSQDVIGKTMVLDDKLNTVVGVLPRNFQFGPASLATFGKRCMSKGGRRGAMHSG